MADAMLSATDAKEATRYDDDPGSKTSLATLVAWVEDAEETTNNARKLSERDRDYYDHIQLTAEEKKTLRDRGQPDVIINRIKPKIDYLCGFEASNRTDPKAFPRTPQDEEAAGAATDALRYVKDKADLDPKFAQVWENMLIEGFGGIELVVEEGRDGNVEIAAKTWEWDRLFYDPHSRKLDFEDARYVGGYVWMDAEDAKERWPDAAEVIERTINESSFSQTYDDRPRWKTWISGKTRKRVRIVQMYHLENGQWWYCIFTKGGKLDSYPVPFVDQDGRSWCPLLLQSTYVNRQNERYGLVRIMVDVQDEINKRRSKALHRLTMRQVVMEEGAVNDVDDARAELAKPDGVIRVNPGFRFEPLDHNDQLRGEFELLQESKNEIELLGPNAAMLGKDKDAPSGRAILANQQSGQTEITLILDRHRHIKKRTYMRVWDLIRQYKNEEWWVRVTDNEKNVRFVGFNRPVTMAEELGKRLESQGMPPPQIEATMQQMQADPMRGPMLQQVIRTENQPTQMWMDITIEQVTDTANIQEEQFQALTALAPAVVFPPSVYIKASSLRNKEELLQELEGAKASPEQQEMNRIMTELNLKKATAETEKMVAEVEKLEADTNKVKLETDMLQQPLGIITPPQVAGEQPESVEASPPPGAPGAMQEQSMPPPG